jgi:hypothetical protein
LYDYQKKRVGRKGVCKYMKKQGILCSLSGRFLLCGRVRRKGAGLKARHYSGWDGLTTRPYKDVKGWDSCAPRRRGEKRWGMRVMGWNATRTWGRVARIPITVNDYY